MEVMKVKDKDIIIKVDDVYKEYWLGSIDRHTFHEEMLRKKHKENAKIPARKKIQALNGVSFEIERGEAVGIIGSNGAGKSTLLKILSRVTAPTKGEVYLDGSLSSMLEVGTGFHPELSGRENIYINGTILGMTRKEIDSKIEDIIEFSEIRDFIDTPVKRYSSGMYVKLAFSVAAYLESDIMILDEVLAVGDMKFQKKCLDKMKELSTMEGRTLLCVSHNMATISKFCKRCIVLDKGKVVFDGDTQEAIRQYFGDNKSTDTFIDLSQNRRFLWLQRDDIRIQTAKYLGKEDAVFWEGEKIHFEFEWLYNKAIVNLCLRVEVLDNTENGVCTAFIYDFENGEKGQRSGAKLDMDISLLQEGKYKTIYTLFVRDTDGESVDLDCVNGLEFEKRLVSERKIVWKPKAWGAIELPELQVIK